MSDDTVSHTLANGARVLVLPLPHLRTASVSAYLHVGSAHESRALNGIGHVAEHMVFKGSATRSARQINLDAERLGAEVNAHTDRDHTAFHLRGLADHAGELVRQLGDIVGAPAFPADELERERQVLLQEYTEDEDDPLSVAFKLFDNACWGLHPAAQPVIGTRRNIERFSRDDLLAHTARHFHGAGLVLGVAGGVAPDVVFRAAEEAFAALPAGQAAPLAPATYAGDVRARALAGSSQTHVVLGGALPPMAAQNVAGTLGAAVLGEGMSSPLMEELREKRGLAYYCACSADVYEHGGQFVIEASLAPAQVEEALTEVVRLLRQQAQRIDPVDLARARHQLAVRRLRQHERSWRRLENAALDALLLGAVRSDAQWLAQLEAVTEAEVRAVFERLLREGLSAAFSGKVPRGLAERARTLLRG